MSATPIASDSLPKLVIDRLIEMMMSGELPQGAKLPTEKELSESLGVSRIALREATQVLKVLGVLESSPRRGTTVVRSAPYAAIQQVSLLVGLHGEALLHLVEARRVLESAAARLAAQRATEDELRTMERCIERQAEALDDPIRFSEQDMLLHRTMVAASRNPVLLRMMDGVARSLWASRKRTAEIPGRLEKALAFHRRLLTALRSRDPDAAERVLRAHLDDLSADISAQGQEMTGP